MKIVLRKLSLINFKGIRKYEVEFSDGINEVVGKNGTGKTSLFDAFLWVLFGKDSFGRKDFGVKTLDADGNEIHNIEHTVCAVIAFDDGKTRALSRTLREKWATEKGSKEAIYKGNETLYEIDNVPLKMSEYNARINEWVGEDLFKLVTNPFAFVGLKMQQQREILMKMAGIGDDREIAEKYGKNGILAILNTDKSITDRQKELAKRKNKLKKELELIPTRIDEASLNINKDIRDIVEIDAEIKSLENGIAKMHEEIQQLENDGGRVELENELRRTEIQLEQAKLAHKSEFKQREAEAREKKLEHESIINGIKGQINSIERNIKESKADISFAEALQDKLRKEYAKVHAEKFPAFDDTVCPCCGREWDSVVLSEKKTKYESKRLKFNADKAKRLEEIRGKGIEFGTTIKDCEARIEKLTAKAAELETQLTDAIESEPTEMIVMPILNAEPYITRIEELKAKLENDSVDTSEQEAEITRLSAKLTDVTSEKSTYLLAQNTRKRIAELNGEMSEKAQAIADIEKEESVIEDFAKTKIDLLDKAVNSRFEKVKFKLYEYQINGGFVECCEPMINGVPYSDLNGAGKINAGLDIIKALQEFYDVKVPLFIDNKEAVNSPLELDCQTIYLKVVGEEQAADVNVIEISKGID
jgi:DNA repair exonuclease SbcCD ATPase subunit